MQSIFKNFKTASTWLKLVFNWVKSNITLIVLIPTFLGGCMQLFELYNISPSFIRFFSLTQVVPDGLMFLFIYGIFFFILIFTLLFLNFFIFLVDSKSHFFTLFDWERSIWKYLIGSIVSILLILYLNYYRLNEDLISSFLNHPKETILLIFLFNWIWSVLYYELYNFLNKAIDFQLNKYSKTVFKKKRDIYQYKAQTIMTIFFIVSYLINITLKTPRLHTKNPKNFDLISEKIIKRYDLLEDPDLIYFNDKYLFYNMVVEGKKSVVIFNFEDEVTKNLDIREDPIGYEITIDTLKKWRDEFNQMIIEEEKLERIKKLNETKLLENPSRREISIDSLSTGTTTQPTFHTKNRLET